MIYLDANIFIYAALDKGEKANSCKKILESVSLKKIAGFTSTLTWDEVVYSLKKHAPLEEVQIQSSLFLKLPNLVFLEPSLEIIEKAEELWLEYNLKPRDAIHAATAIINKINKIVSDDSDFDKVKELKRIDPGKI